MKEEILEAMETLIQDGIPLTTSEYFGTNPDAFLEFAQTNGFELDEVVEVYDENEESLQALWLDQN